MGNKNNDLGIKTAVSARETRVLQALAAGQRVIEVGSLLGYSTIQLARVAKHVDAIDPHNGYPYFNPVPTLPCFLANLQRWSVDARVTARVGLAQDWLPKLNGEFTFIDCTGFYKDTRYCLNHARSPDQGKERLNDNKRNMGAPPRAARQIQTRGAHAHRRLRPLQVAPLARQVVSGVRRNQETSARRTSRRHAAAQRRPTPCAG